VWASSWARWAASAQEGEGISIRMAAL
jgi:hypothetical protein